MQRLVQHGAQRASLTSMAAAYSRDISDRAWYRANQQFLVQALSQVERTLVESARDRAEALNAQMREALNEDLTDGGVLGDSYDGKPFALEQLGQMYALSEFEINTLLLCAGMELRPQWPQLCSAVSGMAYPTITLARKLFAQKSWKGLDPDGALRRSHLIEPGDDGVFASQSLVIDERILHFLTGTQYLDSRLKPLMQSVAVTTVLLPSHQPLVEHIVNAWRPVKADTTQRSAGHLLAAIQLAGNDGMSLRTVATAVCDRHKLTLQEISADALPTDWSELQQVMDLCGREYRLSGLALLLNCDRLLEHSADSASRVAAFIDMVGVPLIVIGPLQHSQRQRPILSKQVTHPTATEQQSLWQAALQKVAAPGLDHQTKTNSLINTIKALVSEFDLSASAIHNICLQVTAEDALDVSLRALCQQQSKT